MLFQHKREAIQAEKSFREGLAVLDPLLQKTPPAAEILRRQAIFVNNLGELFGQNERYAEAEQLLQKNRLYWEDLSARFPTNYEHRSKLALTWRNLAIVSMRSGRTKDAELAFRRAAGLRQKLTDENAEEPHHRNQLGDALRNLSILSAERGDRLEACRLLDQAVRHHQLTVKQSPSMADFMRSLGADWMALADLRRELVRHAEEQRAIKELPGLFAMSAADKVAVAQVLARCVPLLAQEPEISTSQRTQFEERYAAEAVQELAGAIRLGFKDFDSLAKNAAFDAVRGREDYRKLLPTALAGDDGSE
jgi:tetratricopeptide (TPR) repeat protein